MTAPDPAAVAVFLAMFALVSGLGFVAARWRRPATLAHLDEWGLGGRQFGTWVTWFLVGGDFYTAYTVIAVPALVFSVGAYGFFALPYTIVVYPIVFAIMPRVWAVAARAGHVTAADVVGDRTGSRALALAVALTGIAATMPYIALQLIGMRVAIAALGFGGEGPMVAAFAILALYTYAAGLRAPALIAFVKDAMTYVVVIVAVTAIPARLGGYGVVFAAADRAFAARGGSAGLLLAPSQQLPFATLALGSALAAFLYPHTLTGILASRSGDTVRRNAILLPAYTVLLGLIALMGYMAIAAGIHLVPSGHAPRGPLEIAAATEAVPALFRVLFPGWFTGFALAAVAIGALVPAAVMSIGAANLFTRNVWRAHIHPAVTPAGEAQVAKVASLVVKLGALACIVALSPGFAIDFQLLGGVWILQTFPALVFPLFTAWFRAGPLLLGWAAGFATGSWLAWSDGLRPAHLVQIGSHHGSIYVGLIALLANLVVCCTASGVVFCAAASGHVRKMLEKSGRLQQDVRRQRPEPRE